MMMKISELFGSLKRSSKKIQIMLNLSCVVFVLVVILFKIPVMSTMIAHLNYFIYDHIVSLYPHAYKEVNRVIIIDIDDESLAKEGRWPWPRNKLARLLSILQDSGVVVAGMDIIMSSPEINYATGLKNKLKVMSSISAFNHPNTQINPLALEQMLDKIAPEVDNDQALAHILKNFDVTLGFLFHNLYGLRVGTLPNPLTNSKGQLINPKDFNAQYFKGYNASLDLLMKASGYGGFVTNIPDSDGIIRQGLLLGSINGKVYPSLSLMTAMRFLLADHVELKMRNTSRGPELYGLDVAGTFIPTNDSGQVLIPFWGGPYTLPYLSATDVLHGKFHVDDLTGSIALLGSSAIMLNDLHPTPVAPVFPGVEVVGNIIAGIIGQQVSNHYDWHTTRGMSIIAGLGILSSLFIPFLNIFMLIITSILLCAGIIAVCVLVFFSKNLFIPVGCLLTIVILQAMVNYSYEFFSEKRQKFKIRQLFGQYVPESYVDVLINSPGASSMEGQIRHLSVLFCDIRNFTETSENLSAANVKRLLNTFFDPVTEIIFNHQGTIDKYVGDMMNAFWGAPVPIENNGHVRQALCSALSIVKTLPSINEQMAEKGLPNLRIGIGIGSGLMNVGDMGSKFRRAYTVIGDNVNLASRLESLTKYYDVNILVNNSTRKNQEEFLWRIIDKVAVKGRKKTVTIYEPLGFLNEMTQELIEEIERYHKALDSYYEQYWDKASSLFTQLQEAFPNTYLYKLYLERINKYKINPPLADWDGVFIHTNK